MLRAVLSGFLLVFASGASGEQRENPTPQSKLESSVVRFASAVANIEYVNETLSRNKPLAIRRQPDFHDAAAWYGRIHRSLSIVPGPRGPQDIPFVALYEGSVPGSLLCDSNSDGDLTDDPPVAIYPFPAIPGAFAGLVDLAWYRMAGGSVAPISWKIRIVLEPLASPDSVPRFRLQTVFAMEGSILVDGREHRSILYDWNRDELYTQDFGDGVFIDLDDDGEIVVDPSSDEFLPFRVPTQMGGTVFETLQVAATGESVEFRRSSGHVPVTRLRTGAPAPDFETETLDGRRIRLSQYRGHPVVVYFWAAWCGVCDELAPKLRQIYDRYTPQGFEIIGVSFDDKADALRAFEERHREPWPISFAGRGFWENPIGRLYGPRATGAAYLIDADGNFVGDF